MSEKASQSPQDDYNLNDLNANHEKKLCPSQNIN